VITVEDLVVRYGSATALDGVSLNVQAGEMVALVGANGSGKSTLLKALSGVVPRASGRLRIEGTFAHVPEGRQLFPDLTVEDNLVLGAFQHRDRDTAWVYAIFPELVRTRKQRAGTLSGGQQQMVAIARGLMGRPKVLAIDEMSLGLAPLIVKSLAKTLRAINREEGLSVLLVEQSARLALSLCSRAYVLESGRVVADGPSTVLAQSTHIQSAYLGAPSGEPT
jgi:branched-chain amino acid transport system ATP-binding protein